MLEALLDLQGLSTEKIKKIPFSQHNFIVPSVKLYLSLEWRGCSVRGLKSVTEFKVSWYKSRARGHFVTRGITGYLFCFQNMYDG
jgi:hypothetical protein